MSSHLLKTITRNLPCRLTDDELRQRGDALAEVVQELHAEEQRQSDVKAQMKARMTELEAKQTRFAITISRREEYRDVTCDLFADGLRGIVDVSRRDTGEVVESRPMTDDERQKTLPLEPVSVNPLPPSHALLLIGIAIGLVIGLGKLKNAGASE